MIEENNVNHIELLIPIKKLNYQKKIKIKLKNY